MTRKKSAVALALSCPEELLSFTLPQWDLLIRQAREIGLLGTIESRLDQTGLLKQIPDVVLANLRAARNLALFHERVTRWEVHCIQKALSNIETDVVLLKGAAYMLLGLPNARGRLQSDVDILVPKPHLNAVEGALLENGWKGIKLEKYDQRFYREWSHELPPLVHDERATVIDIHHNILPQVGRLHPSADRLLQAASPILGTPYKSLSPPDMVLHVSAHLFQDGDLSGGLRELADIDGLLRAFSNDLGFWDSLVERAIEMTLCRPVFYALRYTKFYLETPIPTDIMNTSSAWAPSGPVLCLMDKLVSRSLTSEGASSSSAVAKWLLYFRSHWLRMPPILLTRHFLYKCFRRIRKKA